METRKITFILESANTVKTIQSSAETLGELKRELDANGIDYQGKVFREGLSRTELLSDEAVLPYRRERDSEWDPLQESESRGGGCLHSDTHRIGGPV